MEHHLLPAVFKAGEKRPYIQKYENPKQNQCIGNSLQKETKDGMILKQHGEESMIQKQNAQDGKKNQPNNQPFLPIPFKRTEKHTKISVILIFHDFQSAIVQGSRGNPESHNRKRADNPK